jgi:multiple sugar transport system permease protein
VRPSIRSRAYAATAAFVLGFGVANYGILRVPGNDRWVWFAVAIVLMLTGSCRCGRSWAWSCW